MSLNTMIIGAGSKLVEPLKNDNTIALKCWFSNRKFVKDQSIGEELFLEWKYFQSLKWTQKYMKEIAKYTEGVEFNAEVYNKIYKKLYVFIDQHSRLDGHLQQKPIHHYINQFNLLYNFFYGLLLKEQIQLVLLGDLPHFGFDTIIYEIAKALNIKTLITLQSSTITSKFYYFDNVDDFGDFHFMTKQEYAQEVKLEKTFFTNPSYVRLVQSLKKPRYTLLGAIARSIVKPHRFFEFFSYNYLRYLRVKRHRKNFSAITSSVDYSKKYVYFPLHRQPEATTSTLGGMFCDQLLALELLSKKMPSDWLIYVKENPIQTDFMRNEAFFVRLKQIDNLRMVSLEESTFQLMGHSQFVATINGTAGWEAICGGKPALVFGQAWYQNFEGVFKWHNDIDIREVANYQIDHTKLEKDYNHLASKLTIGVIHPTYIRTVVDYDENKNTQDIVRFLEKLVKEVSDGAILPCQTQNKAAY